MTDGYARRALGGQVQAADPAPGQGRHVEGLAVPWGAQATGTVEYGDLSETFDPHAFDGVIGQGRRVPLLDRHDGDVVGMAEVYAAPDGLRFRGDLLADDPAADAYARRVAAGADGVSIEFRPGRVRRGPRSVVHLAVDRLAAIAGAYAPALVGAQVALRRDNAMTEPRDPEPTPEPEPTPPPPTPALSRTDVDGIVARQVADLRRLIAEGGTHQEATGLVFRSLAEAWRAIDANRADQDHHEWYARALADIVTGDAPGVMTPGVQGGVRGIIDPGRPGITAFGREGLSEGGMSVDWPYFGGTLAGLVGVQATEKSEIVSAKVPILKGTAALATYAGGADISYQLLRRSSPSYLEAWSRIMLAAYAVVTDAAFVDAVEAAATGTESITWATATEAAVRSAIFSASVKVQDATGRPAEFVLAAADTFGIIGGALVPVNPTNANGTANAANLSPVLSGLPVRYDANVDAGTAVVSNSLAAAWHEDGPFQASEEDVARLGRNVAYWGMAAPAVYLPAGVVIMGPAVATRSKS
jgi:phage head maturation protease